MGADRRIYSRAPITEAVIDIRVEWEEKISPEALSSLKNELSKSYPRIEQQFENTFTFKLGEQPQAQPNVSQNGFRYTDARGQKVLQAKPGGFTFSWLTPYEKWEPFRDEAFRLWKIYAALGKFARTTRTAVRFINRFDLPGNVVDLEDYFTVYPHAPKGIDFNGVVLQLLVPDPKSDSNLIVNQALVPTTKVDVVSILLDLDLHNQQPRTTEKDLWDFFEILHDRKNELFESMITDKARDLIK